MSIYLVVLKNILRSEDYFLGLHPVIHPNNDSEQMKDITLYSNDIAYSAELNLPYSKSIVNRMLIIQALCGKVATLDPFSVSDDIETLADLLQFKTHRLNAGPAGTVMRFMTALLAQREGEWELDGSERMRERPIKVLVDALNDLGGELTYLGKAGFPPLLIRGKRLQGGTIKPNASVSSQYISALLLVAPYMREGLTVELTGTVVSLPYIEMTVMLMQRFGADVSFHPLPDAPDVHSAHSAPPEQLNTDPDGAPSGHTYIIKVKPKPYSALHLPIETDWTGASYFYELLAVLGKGHFKLSGLREKSLQGDAQQVALWEQMGVSTAFVEGGVLISANGNTCPHFTCDFRKMPDLVQSFVVACCLKGICFDISGIETLRYKETDRVQALVSELLKLGYPLSIHDNTLLWQGERTHPPTPPTSSTPPQVVIETYNDHRMAMAFSIAAVQFPGLVISDSEVVNKSFPRYWEELGKVLHP
ncbi:3-phosphoshikimate 1-carboxyvinyltransferase [Bacteroidia bacterium]|nr:3-phosphoshikimate 1-carboxyvinyltransferase [Bacteroidia bacterium]